MAELDPQTPVARIDWTAVCQKIYARHAPKILVITLGAEGMLVAKEGQVTRRIPTCAREVFDVSGAGDTVIAALSVALATGHDLEESARFANTAAGIVVGKFGTAVASPAEILNFGRQHATP
jgi:D-beta-D-heptose 7-phosphate kinase/D-beta-D-heptose 1-phosphate adenosyltransferase